MLGMAFLVGMVLLTGLFVTMKSKAAATTYIQAGDDEFETTNNGETYHNFAASKIPANFFGPGSQPYSGLVPLEGEALAAGSDTDTVIHRNQDVYTPGSTTLTMTGLSLKGISSITVTYNNGVQEAWNLRVGLSAFKASTGTMSIGSGGTFDSTLKVWPRFTLTKVSDPTVVKVLDMGGSGLGLTAFSRPSRKADVGVESIAIAHPGEPVPAPCRVIAVPTEPVAIDQVEHAKAGGGAAVSAAVSVAAAGSCPPVTLTSTNSPWALCPGFCIPRPITEQELLASHFASPPGTKKAAANAK